MRTILRILAAAVVTAGAALGNAGTAQADQQVLEGVYNYTQADGLSGTWTIYPICAPTVGDLREPLYLPVGCRLLVQAFTGVTGGDARVTNGVWAYTTTLKEGVACPDGTFTTVVETYEFNTDTMTGTRNTTYPPACNATIPASIIKTPFTLAFKEKLPIPVDQYPLICEPGGLRRCF